MRLWEVRIVRASWVSLVLSMACCALAPIPLGRAQEVVDAAAPSPDGFQAVFTAGSRDAEGRFMGGTELRLLTAHAGKLYAGSGFWEDEPGPEGFQGAEILVLDRPGGPWRVDAAFDETMANGRPRNLAISALREVTFSADGAGKPLPEPVSMLVAATWDLTGSTGVFTRDDASGAWSFTGIGYDPRPPGSQDLPQVRSLGVHRDRVTGIQYVFAGQNPHGIFSASYDAAAPGRLQWGQAPELDLSTISASDFPELKAQLRVTSFAECGERLYAAVGEQVYVRVDGTKPSWRLRYSNPKPGRSQTGLRGLTAVPGPGGQGIALAAAVEGKVSRIVRIDPDDGHEVTELDLQAFLAKSWGMTATYVIAAYNDMAIVHDPSGQDAVLIGFQAFIPLKSPVAPGHGVVDVGYGRLDDGAWYLVRRSSGHYDLRRIPALSGHRPMVSTRTILASPFPHDDAIYLGGYDANRAPAHNTAWIVRAAHAAAVGSSQ